MNLIISATDSASTALKNISGNVDKLDGKVKGANSKWGGMKAAIGAAAIAAGVFAGVKIVGDKINDMDALAKSARKAGSAASEDAFRGFQVLGQAMDEAGINTATYERALLNVSTKLKMGTEGQKSFASITDKMGESILKANGELKTGPDLLVAMTNALNEGTITMEDFSKVVGGKAGPEIAAQFASLNTSAEALQATLDDVAANSNIVPLGAANNAEAFNDTIGRLKNSFGQLFTDALTPLMPVLADLADNILAAMPAIIDTISGALEKMQPLWKIIGLLFSEVIVPVLGLLFDILGKVFDVIMPLYEKALPKLEKAIEIVKEVIEKIVEKIVGAVEAIIEFKDTISDMAGGVKDKVKDMASKVGDKFDDMTGGMVGKTKDAIGAVVGWFSSGADEIVIKSIVPDMVRAILEWFKTMGGGMVGQTRLATEKVIEVFEENKTGVVAVTKEMADDVVKEYTMMVDGIEKAISKKTVVGLFQLFANKQRINQAPTKMMEEYAKSVTEANEQLEINDGYMRLLQANFDATTMSLDDVSDRMNFFGIQSDTALGKAVKVSDAIAGGFRGMAGSIGDTFYDMFTGVVGVFDGLRNIAAMVFQMIAKAVIQTMIVKPLLAMMGFQHGGLAAGGRPAIVGENGPELIVPSGNTRVFSNSQSKGILSDGNGNGGPLTVNFNLNAVSTRDGVEFLIENKNIITNVIQEAYHTIGRAGPLG